MLRFASYASMALSLPGLYGTQLLVIKALCLFDVMFLIYCLQSFIIVCTILHSVGRSLIAVQVARYLLLILIYM